MLRHISHGDEGETWLEEFPGELVARLSAIPDGQMQDLSVAWGKTDELMCDGAQLMPVLADLRRLAQAALATSRVMYLWGSL
jgi:hypothetical protein